MSQSRNAADTAIHAEACHRAGLLDDALALLAAERPSPPIPDTLLGLLLRGSILADQVFFAYRGYDEAVAALEEARTLAEQRGDEIAAADALELLALADDHRAMHDGGADYHQLLARFQSTLARREALGDTRGVAESLFHVGLMHERLHEGDRAAAAHERAYALAGEHGHKRERSYAARHLGFARVVTGDRDAALAYFEESLALRQEIGYTLYPPPAHVAVGDALLARGNIDGAARHYERAHALAQGMQTPMAVVFLLLSLAELAQARGDRTLSRGHAERALARAQADHLPLGVKVASAMLESLGDERA